MIQYLLDLSLTWGIFLGVYFIFLRKITFFRTNRIYLLSSLTIGLLLPLLRYIDYGIRSKELIEYIPIVEFIQESPHLVNDQIGHNSNNFLWYIVGIYLVGSLFFLARLVKGLNNISRIYKSGEKENRGTFILVYTKEDHLPFSFGNAVFISRNSHLQNEINQIITHESTHIKSRHTFDIIYLEILNIFLWFIPFLYFFKSAIKQIHEYEADAAVLIQTNKKMYGHILLRQSLSGIQIALAHSFFHSNIKNRINMMYQKKSGRIEWTKYLFALPLLLLLSLAFSKIEPESSSNELAEVSEIVKSQFKNEAKSDSTVYEKVDQLPIFPGCNLDQLAGKELNKCSNKHLFEYIFSQLLYPEKARKKGLEGKVHAQFIVETSGEVSNVKITKGLSPDCDAAVVDIIESMNSMGQKWLPGKNNGKEVRVKLVLPVGFALGD